MDNVIPFPIHTHGGRPHQAASYDKRGAPVPSDVVNKSSEGITHVREGIALTPTGVILLKRAQERVS